MRVSDIKPYSAKSQEIERKIKSEIEPIVAKAYNKLPKWKLRTLTNGYKIAMYFLFILIIPGFIMYLLRTGVLGSFNSEVIEKSGGNFTIYKKAIDATGLATAIKPRTISNALHYQLRSSSVPPDARIVNVIKGVQCESIHKTDIVTNHVVFRWVRRNGKNTQVYYYYQSMLVCGTDFMQNFSLVVTKDNILKKLFSKEKTQLENVDFEKRFHLNQNDPIKLRQCFTPLIMENYLKYDNELPLSDLKIIKVKHAIYVTWASNQNYLVVNGRSFKDTSSPAGIADGIWGNISSDTKELYTAMAYVESLPLFKNERTYQKDIANQTGADGFGNIGLRRLLGLAAAVELSKEEEEALPKTQ